MPRTTAYNCLSSGDSSSLEAMPIDHCRLSGFLLQDTPFVQLRQGLADCRIYQQYGQTIGVAVTCGGTTSAFAIHPIPPSPLPHNMIARFHFPVLHVSHCSDCANPIIFHARLEAEPTLPCPIPCERQHPALTSHDVDLLRTFANWRNRTCGLRFTFGST